MPGSSTVQPSDGTGPAVYTSIELFTGGGGLAWAMHEAGFQHLLVNELEPRACATLRINVAEDLDPSHAGIDPPGDRWPLYERDVHRVDFEPWEGRADVVAGGVPCQPWSLGGAHKGYDDARNLWPQLFRCVRETRPKAVIAENVRGLLRPSFKPYYEYILRELEAPFEQRVNEEDWRDHDKRLQKILQAEGDPTERYHVWCLPVNAADYGIPQVRQRVFVIAFRKDLGLGDWTPPAVTHSELSLLQAQADGSYWEEHGVARRLELIREVPLDPDGRERWQTVRDAISDLPEPIGDRIEHPDWIHHYGWPGARHYPGHTPNDLDRPAKTVKAGVHGVPGGETVLKLDDGSIRYMTVREVARVMTFPDAWRLAGPRGEQMRQLGNAVPVDLGRIMADAVMHALKKSEPEGETTAVAQEHRGRLGPRDPAVTSRMMAAIRSKDSKAELSLRRALHAAGLRYRLHAKDVIGHPDIVIRSRRLAVFVDGDMWHGNPEEVKRRGRETLAELFPSRTEWWVAKIERNMARDQEVMETLQREGWTVIRLWEHDVLYDPDAAVQRVLEASPR